MMTERWLLNMSGQDKILPLTWMTHLVIWLSPSHTANAKIMFFPTLQIFTIVFHSKLWTDGAARFVWTRDKGREVGKSKRDTEKCDAVMETDVLCIWTIGNSMWSVWFMPVDLIHEHWLFTSAVKQNRQMCSMFCLKINWIMFPSHTDTQRPIGRAVLRAVPLTKWVLLPSNSHWAPPHDWDSLYKSISVQKLIVYIFTTVWVGHNPILVIPSTKLK